MSTLATAAVNPLPTANKTRAFSVASPDGWRVECHLASTYDPYTHKYTLSGQAWRGLAQALVAAYDQHHEEPSSITYRALEAADPSHYGPNLGAVRALAELAKICPNPGASPSSLTVCADDMHDLLGFIYHAQKLAKTETGLPGERQTYANLGPIRCFDAPFRVNWSMVKVVTAAVLTAAGIGFAIAWAAHESAEESSSPPLPAMREFTR
jgi:hypothetical protein